MPKYSFDIGEEDFERLKSAIEEIAKDGPFSAPDVLLCVMEAGLTSNADDVAAAIEDLVDLGYIRPLAGPRLRWEARGLCLKFRGRRRLPGH